jgi:hypothetical protein
MGRTGTQAKDKEVGIAEDQEALLVNNDNVTHAADEDEAESTESLVGNHTGCGRSPVPKCRLCLARIARNKTIEEASKLRLRPLHDIDEEIFQKFLKLASEGDVYPHRLTSLAKDGAEEADNTKATSQGTTISSDVPVTKKVFDIQISKEAGKEKAAAQMTIDNRDIVRST